MWELQNLVLIPSGLYVRCMYVGKVSLYTGIYIPNARFVVKNSKHQVTLFSSICIPHASQCDNTINLCAFFVKGLYNILIINPPVNHDKYELRQHWCHWWWLEDQTINHKKVSRLLQHGVSIYSYLHVLTPAELVPIDIKAAVITRCDVTTGCRVQRHVISPAICLALLLLARGDSAVPLKRASVNIHAHSLSTSLCALNMRTCASHPLTALSKYCIIIYER